MNENMKKFLEEASKNEELKAKLAALTDKDTAVAKAIEIAKEYGFTLTAEDFKPADGAELSTDELKAVAGGGDCIVAGGGKPVDPDDCSCAWFGNGSGNLIQSE